MTTVSIPKWNAQGVLPPIDPINPTSTERSPYVVSLTDLALHFGTSKGRQKILMGFLEFRSALHAAGVRDGFQWVDGSFLENIESIESRDPADIDVVTFFHLPNGETQQTLATAHSALFTNASTKANYLVDSYFVTLNDNPPENLVERSAYWYSLWSHRRTGQWKGYLQIDLSPGDDTLAKTELQNAAGGGARS